MASNGLFLFGTLEKINRKDFKGKDGKDFTVFELQILVRGDKLQVFEVATRKAEKWQDKIGKEVTVPLYVRGRYYNGGVYVAYTELD